MSIIADVTEIVYCPCCGQQDDYIVQTWYPLDRPDTPLATCRNRSCALGTHTLSPRWFADAARLAVYNAVIRYDYRTGKRTE